ncbi:TIGR03943 family putative permease subunit [Bacillus sonorensis]|uniref:TIGR03943 family putative permease subunit n=2 Tax=Bacillus sonorensis TaxID=119858 RepID=UPI001F1EDCC2|nr:TIGR03943 family protein [Bacillus sonorensis]MCF7619937.1 TIGR03943 family protein [Bacillus sonorensis]MCY8034623.1 TIGR03943 family protein [Bacillus sonorensis]MCY8563106.1 TIGR03943 family protein [Bacillus sonorensis]
MFRTLILMFFTFFFFHLHASGNLTKYINMKYAYLSYIAIFLLAILTAVQFYLYLKGANETECGHDCGCGHDHSHEKDQPFFKRMFIYFVFLFPLCTGLFLPVATLDSNIVKSKGFSFKAIKQPEHYSQTQYLRPDTSIYYGQDGYDELMEKALKNYKGKKRIALQDEDYLKGMEAIYNAPGEFLDKTIEFSGFAFKGESIHDRQLFVLRFGIIHCIADSGVYGMLVEFPDDINIKNDQWLHVKGTLTSQFYQPFKSTIPVLQVTEWSKIKEPKDPYVYRTY